MGACFGHASTRIRARSHFGLWCFQGRSGTGLGLQWRSGRCCCLNLYISGPGSVGSFHFWLSSAMVYCGKMSGISTKAGTWSYVKEPGLWPSPSAFHVPTCDRNGCQKRAPSAMGKHHITCDANWQLTLHMRSMTGSIGTVAEGPAQAQSNAGGCYSSRIFLTWEYTRFYDFFKRKSQNLFF